jgi:hypothetical protein
MRIRTVACGGHRCRGRGYEGQSDGDGLEQKGRGTGALCSCGTAARCGLAAEGRVGEAVWG